MELVRKNKVTIIALISLIIMTGSVFFWNYISKKQASEKKEAPIIDVSDANNVPSVDAKLGSDIKITQSYLLNYTTKKSGIWYMSKAYVKDIKIQKKEAILTFSLDKNSKKVLKGFIQADKCIVKKGDIVNFVGTIDLETGSIELSRVSLEEIDYKSVTGIEINELIDNIKAVKNNYFVVSGYMVTDSDKYKLFESKSSYLKDKNVGTYFYLNWKDKFNYTGNQEVKVKCKILDTYKLNYCELME